MNWRNDANLRWLGNIAGVEVDRPLAKFTSFNIGGRADFMAEEADPSRLVATVGECRRRGIPVRVIGAGTNLLIADAGIEGLVVRNVDRRFAVDGHRVFAGAGLKMMRLARLAADADLDGLDFAIGIPGTVGGAVYQNAGCWGSEVAAVLDSAAGDGGEQWPAQELALGYRTSALRDGLLQGRVITGAWFALAPGNGALARQRMAEWTEARARTQPISTKNCGSVFRNPPGDSAGRLVEAVGLKGARCGDAQFSDVHANFIINQGHATAANVCELIERARTLVREQYSVELETEVELVGRT